MLPIRPALALPLAVLGAFLAGCVSPRPDVVPSLPDSPCRVTLDSPSPLVSIVLMFRAGSTSDPPGKEGLASLTADALLEGGFGDPASPVTKERLAEMVEPLGDGAIPSAQVASDTTTFHIKVPREAMGKYLSDDLGPLLGKPLFAAAEVERLKKEMAAAIPRLRYESVEELGLAAIDELVLRGTRYEHRTFGCEGSIPKLTREDVAAFYREHYRPANLIIGISSSDPGIAAEVGKALAALPRGGGPESYRPAVRPLARSEAVIVEVPDAPAASVHLAFPYDIDRTKPDYWPLLVASTWLGVHRDSFGRLYQSIREERGYNYGDYSYLEPWDGRPESLFEEFNQPRRTAYFSIWLRPVQHEYAAHVMKAAAHELERMVREGLTPAEVEAAKRKAEVLYLSLAETTDRLLEAEVDSAFLGLSPGYLEGWLERIRAVTPAQVNAALRAHLRPEGIEYLVVTDSKHAKALRDQLLSDRPAWGKGPREYLFEEVTLPDGKKAWQVPEEKIETLRLDAVWAHQPLGISDVRIVPVDSIFKTGTFSTAME